MHCVGPNECELVEVSPSWLPLEHPELLSGVLSGARVLPDFVTPEEESTIMGELEPQLKKLRYEFEHWDGAIQGYRETEREQLGPGAASSVVERLREVARVSGGGAGLLPRLHVLDLAPTGQIAPHIDAVRVLILVTYLDVLDNQIIDKPHTASIN